MKKISSLIAIGLLVVSCGGNDPNKKTIADLINDAADKVNESSKPQSVSIESLFEKEYESAQTLEFEGFIGAIPSTISWSGGRMTVEIVERRSQTGGRSVRLDMPLGKDKNHVYELPETYKQSDLKVVADDGTILGVGDRVKVKATGYYRSGDYCSIDVVSVQAIDGEFDPAVFEKAVPLTNAILEDTAAKSVYCYMEGNLAIPTVFFSMYGEIGLKFTTKTNSKLDKVDVMVGSGPSTMNVLPDSYTAKDLVVRDYAGNEIPRGGKVRVYGVWDRYSFKSSGSGPNGTFKLEEIKGM